MADTTKQSFDTPNIQADQANLLVHSTTRIAAPASLVFRTLRNTETWKDWNKWIPRVNVTYQPPDEDLATSAEIEELVRNTSIAGSYDSDLTDGLVGGDGLRNKLGETSRPETPPLKLRRSSQVSHHSLGSGSDSGVPSSPPVAPANGVPRMSAAQRFAAAQADRRGSTASAMSGISENSALETPSSTLKPASSTYVAVPISASPRASISAAKPEIDPTGRRKSKTPSLQKMMKARQDSLNLLYGEPSVRLQLHTRVTFYVRMNPNNPREMRETHVAVIEVSRPDDPVTDGANLTQLTRSHTHTLNRTSVYRIVWAMDNTMSSVLNVKNGSAFPKSLLVTERIHEIRPIVLGDGSEECELRTWELQKGPVAKMVKKKYGDFLQKQFEVWGRSLGDYCEAMAGKNVDRRDFIVLDQDANSVGVITF